MIIPFSCFPWFSGPCDVAERAGAQFILGFQHSYALLRSRQHPFGPQRRIPVKSYQIQAQHWDSPSDPVSV